jgi:phage gp29-like protein
MPLYDSNVSQWRIYYNPLQNLNLPRAVQMLASAEMGYLSDLSWAYKFISKRDATLKSCVSRRTSAIKKLEYKITIDETADVDQELAQAQQQYLQSFYSKIKNLKKSIEWLATAEFYGYAHLEKHYDSQGACDWLEPVPQWFWCKRYPDARFLYQPKALQSTQGIEIDESDFIIRTVDSPINEIALICFIRKGLSQKDWDGFVETFGIPPVFIELPQGVGLTDEYQAMADKVIANSRGILGNGSKVQTVDVGMRGQTPFKPHIDYQDSQIVLAATGGLLSSLTGASQPVVGNTGESDANEKIFDELARSEAIDISECFQNWIDIPELKRVFGDDVPILAKFELAHQQIDSVPDIIGDAVRLGSVGLQIDPKQITDQTGYNLARAAQPGMPGAGMGGGYQDAAQSYMNAKKAETKAQCQKIMNAIRKISPTSPDLKKFSACVPEMLG